MITLTLLHPLKSTPIQSWTFDQETRVSIGRSTDNHVVLYSAVVSRYHVELCCENGVWEVVSLGANGTYIDDQRVIRSPLKDGVVFRLARSGPNLQVNIQNAISPRPSASPPRFPLRGNDVKDVANLPNVPMMAKSGAKSGVAGSASQPQSASSDAFALASERISKILEDEESSVSTGELLFDTQTGQPLKTVKALGAYQILKRLGQGTMATTYLVWSQGQTFVLKHLNVEWSQNIKVVGAFKQQARSLQSLRHPGIPLIVDILQIEGRLAVVMEMVYGNSLREYVTSRGAAIPQSEAIALALEICDVLGSCHTAPQPIVHGDLQPRHILRRQVLRSGQEIVLVDFGGARWQAWQAGLTNSSKGYVAPELATQPPTPASDVYALGTTLAYLLTSENPQKYYSFDNRFCPESMKGVHPTVVHLLENMTNPDPQSRLSVGSIAQILRQII